jgi:hypothetical protein
MGMTEVWNFRDEALARIDVRGFELRARDGTVGKVVQAIEGRAGGYLVIDPGIAMPLGRQLLVPGGLVEKVDVDRRRVVVRADHKQIENAPEYDPAQPLGEPSRRALGNYFRSLIEELTGRSSRRAPARSRQAATRARPRRATTRARRSAPASRSRTKARAGEPPTKEELYEQAKKLDIPGRSKMSKAQLARAVGRRKQSRARQSSRRTSSAKATPVAVQAFLEGVGYPAGKRKLLREAESRRASRDVRSTLRRLPDKQFKSPTEVSKAIGRLG